MLASGGLSTVGKGCLMNKRVTQTEYEALAAFRYALRRFLRFSEEAAHAVGLTPQQHQALLAIKGFPERERATISDLAERLQIRHHSAVGLVDRLAGQGLVVRAPAQQDRRQVHVTLSPAGSRLLEQLALAHKEELRRIGPELSLLLQSVSARSDG